MNNRACKSTCTFRKVTSKAMGSLGYQSWAEVDGFCFRFLLQVRDDLGATCVWMVSPALYVTGSHSGSRSCIILVVSSVLGPRHWYYGMLPGGRCWLVVE